MSKNFVPDYNEVISVVRQKTFAMQQAFKRAGESEGESPMNIYGGGNISRFPVTIIENGKAVTANIPVADAPYIFTRSEFAINKAMEMELDPSSVADAGDKSIAYTVKLKSSRFKELDGKTPAQALLENADKYKELLNEHYKWLSDNVGKYSKNKAQMDAIMEASKLSKEGKLNAQIAGKSRAAGFRIYNSGPKGNMRDEKESKKHPGTYFCYELSIDFRFDYEYPVAVKVENYYAPIVKKEAGSQNVIKSEMVKGDGPDGPSSTEMLLSISEWCSILYRMKMSMRNFEMLNAKTCFNEYLEHDKAVRQGNFKNRVAV